MLRFSDFAFEERRTGEARFAPVKAVVTSGPLEQEHTIEIGGTIYPLREEISGVFETIGADLIQFKVEGSEPFFVGRGGTNGEAFRDWCDQVHSAFQALYRRRQFELSQEEEPRWTVLKGLIDVDAYWERTPVVLNETGWITGPSIGMREVTWWPSERRELVPLDKMPVEFAGFGSNQWFDAIVERDRRTWALRRSRHVQKTEPIAPMDEEEAAEQLAAATPISALPEVTDGAGEP